MPTDTWKSIERAICRMFGGTRRWKGEAGNDCVGTSMFSVEVKHGAQVPKKLEKYMLQAEGDCAEDCVPVVVMHPHGTALLNSYVMMRLKDFREYYLYNAPDND